MPTKDARDALALTAAMRFALLTGRSATVKLEGCWAAVQAGMWGHPTEAQVWAAHRETLVAEAKAAGFEPFFQTRRRPTGPAVDRWARRFQADPANRW